MGITSTRMTFRGCSMPRAQKESWTLRATTRKKAWRVEETLGLEKQLLARELVGAY